MDWKTKLPSGTLNGSYRICTNSGVITGLSANNSVFAIHWTDTSYLMLLTKLRVEWRTVAAWTGATVTDMGFDAYFARSFTVAPTGGTSLTLTTNNAKCRTAYGTTKLALARIATTGALGAGTNTPDAQPFAQSIGHPNVVNAAAGTEYQNNTLPLLDFSPRADECPIVLAANEGILLRSRAAFPAAGSGIITVTFAWDEIAGTE